MLFMCVTTSVPAKGNETIKRRLEKGRMLPAGVTVLGEWAVLSGAGGFMLVESKDPKALLEAVRASGDVARIEAFPVINAGEVLPQSRQTSKKKKLPKECVRVERAAGQGFAAF
jgi:hypothetical protein